MLPDGWYCCWKHYRFGTWRCASGLEGPGPPGSTVGWLRQHSARTVLGRARRRSGSNLTHHLDSTLTVAGLFARAGVGITTKQRYCTKMEVVLVLLVCDR